MSFALVAGEVCLTLLVALVLVLRHLKAMRITTGEIAALAAKEQGRNSVTAHALNAVGTRLDDIEKRLVHLTNRTALK